MKPQITVSWRNPAGGYCMGCGNHKEDILHINASGWITRFCNKCMNDIITVSGISQKSVYELGKKDGKTELASQIKELLDI